jgi:hypothetical protein
MNRSFVVVAIVAATIAVVLLGCGASFEQAKVRGSNINSMMAIKDVSIALERYRHAHGSYPTAHSFAELQRAVAPALDRARSKDRWGEELLVDVTADSYVVTSKGDDRTGGPESGGAVSTPGHSITLRDAVFVQYDASVELTARKYEAEIEAVRNESPLNGRTNG